MKKELNLAYFQTKSAHRWLLFSLIISLIGTAFGILQFSILSRVPISDAVSMLAIVVGWVVTVGLILAYVQFSKGQVVNRHVFKLIYGLYALDIIGMIMASVNVRSIMDKSLMASADYSTYFAFSYFGGAFLTGAILMNIVLKGVPFLIAYVTDLRIKEYNVLVTPEVSEEQPINVVEEPTSASVVQEVVVAPQEEAVEENVGETTDEA